MEPISNFRGAVRQDSLERFSFLFSGKKKVVGCFVFFVVVVFPTILYLALKKKKKHKKNFITAKCRTAGRDITCTVTKSLCNWGFKLFFFPVFLILE